MFARSFCRPALTVALLLPMFFPAVVGTDDSSTPGESFENPAPEGMTPETWKPKPKRKHPHVFIRSQKDLDLVLGELTTKGCPEIIPGAAPEVLKPVPSPPKRRPRVSNKLLTDETVTKGLLPEDLGPAVPEVHVNLPEPVPEEKSPVKFEIGADIDFLTME